MLIGPQPRATTLLGLTDREVGMDDGEHLPARAVELAPWRQPTIAWEVLPAGRLTLLAVA